MSNSMKKNRTLWPDGAPYAQGNGNEDQPTLTAYIATDAPTDSAIVVCPGGGYQGRAQHEGEPVAEWLNSLGISAFVLHYRVSPYRHPVPLLDVQRALRYVRHDAPEWGINRQKIGLLGFSAGGHLVATAATKFDQEVEEVVDAVDRQHHRPDFTIMCYPVISMLEYVHVGSRDHLLGPNSDWTLREELSAEEHVQPNTPPAFLWHTADDAAVPVEHSLRYAQALRRQGIPFDLHVYESGQHGLGLATDNEHVRSWTYQCALWLGKKGFA